MSDDSRFIDSFTLYKWFNGADDPRKTEHLLALEGAEERLKLFKANLLEEGSFDSAIDGCEGVFHTASPFYHDVKDPQVSLSHFGASSLPYFY